jgi:carboxymethylenebutenolidase
LAAQCVIAARETIGGKPAISLAHRVLKALWQEEKDTGDPATLAALIRDVGLDADALMALGAEERWAEQRRSDTEAALARGVFGAPSYVIGGEIFWGQDRLDFVERRLARA